MSDIGRLIAEGDRPDTPISVGSPFATQVTKVLARHHRDLEEGAVLMKGLPARNLLFTETVEQSKALDRLRGFHIVIAASAPSQADWQPERLLRHRVCRTRGGASRLRHHPRGSACLNCGAGPDRGSDPPRRTTDGGPFRHPCQPRPSPAELLQDRPAFLRFSLSNPSTESRHPTEIRCLAGLSLNLTPASAPWSFCVD
ncbi:MAG: hypothetical protein ACK4MX_05745 [Thermaurantiacus sp.]